MVLWVEAIKLSKKLFRLPTYLLAKMAKSAWHRLRHDLLADEAKSAWHRLGNCWLGCCLRGGALQSHQFLSDGSIHHLQQLRQGLTGKVAVNDSVIAKHGDQDLASVVDRSVGEAAG